YHPRDRSGRGAGIPGRGLGPRVRVLVRRWDRQSRRFPRSPEPRGGLAAPDRVRLPAQRLGDLAASAFVSGNDVEAVRSVVGQAIARARSGGGPSLIEARTWRWRGHWAGDQQTYRDDAA